MDKEILNAPDIIKEFLIYLESIKGRSEKTVKQYYYDLRTFFRFIKYKYGLAESNIDLNEIDIANVSLDLIKKISISDAYEFLIFCKNDHKNNECTRARKVSCLKSYFKYLTVKTHKLETNVLEELDAPKMKKTLPKYLTLEQSVQLLHAADGQFEKRNQAILTLFLNCGLRLSELCSLNLSDMQDKALRITGKGNKERIVYLNDACVSAIKEYLPTRPNDGVSKENKNALFLSRQKKRISNRMVENVVYNTLEKAGLGNLGFSAHKLRHTAATLMYQYGHVDIRLLQEILGHENLGTTEIYTHVANKQIQEATNANPLANLK